MVTLTILFTLTILGAVSAHADTSLSLQVNQSTAYSGDNITFTANLTRQNNGNGINSQTVHFLVNGHDIGHNVTQGATGTATLKFNTSNQYVIIGSNIVQAVFYKHDNPDYEGSVSTLQYFTVNSKSPTTLTVDPASGTKGSTVTLRAKLTSGSTVLAGKNVVFKVGGSTVGAPVSFDGTYYTCSYTISQSRGTYTNSITAEFAGDSNYYGSNGANTLNVLNSNPIANLDTVSTNKNSYVDITTSSLLANDNDPDGDSLSIISVGSATHGTVSLNGGTITFTPTTGYSGTGSFTYTVSDGNGGTAIGTVTVTIVNHAPVAVNDAANANKNSYVDITTSSLLANDNDPDGDSLSIISVGSATHGTVSLNGGTITFTPTTGYSGTGSFTYTVSDGDGGTAIGTVTVNIVNHAPVATNYPLTTTPEDTILIGNVVGSDVDGDSLTYALGNAPQHGTAIINPDGSASYMPGKDYTGIDSFTYTVSDGDGGTDIGTVIITVTPVNDAPTVPDYDVTTPEDTQATGNIVGSDVDSSLTYSLKNQAARGTAVVNPDGSWTYMPGKDYTGDDSFTVDVFDGEYTVISKVTIHVTPVNDAPVANNDFATTKEDTSVNIDVKANDSDVDGDSLTVISVTDPAHGSVVINADGTVTYTPDANYYGTDSFTYTVSDGNQGTATGTVNITVERAVASVYVLTTVSKNNPAVGETIIITFKLGNKGPDAADDVVFTYVIPEGMEFVSLETQSGYPEAVYDPATRTITWTLGTVPVLDPWLKVNLKVLKAGNFNINPTVTTSTYDPTLGTSIQTATVNAVNVANAASNTSSTVGMQETGVPFVGLILAILAVFVGLVMPKRK